MKNGIKFGSNSVVDKQKIVSFYRNVIPIKNGLRMLTRVHTNVKNDIGEYWNLIHFYRPFKAPSVIRVIGNIILLLDSILDPELSTQLNLH